MFVFAISRKLHGKIYENYKTFGEIALNLAHKSANVDFFPLCFYSKAKLSSVFKTNGTFFVKIFAGHEIFADLLKRDSLSDI
jgi:hypothetical protein